MKAIVRYPVFWFCRTVAHAGEPDQQARRSSQEELPGHVELGGEQTAVRTPQLIREYFHCIKHTSRKSSVVYRLMYVNILFVKYGDPSKR